mmetsp:Transcript_13613/g.13352  ORF Transcript_13613/g.13352 Transcript_13613/m.13352 type:complete len:114 (-) Transcript_13613:361-702(-)|eukprot:CAMPEP_0170541550 /NCGR_PEP_ID=MMETSP0211-20121228/1253_1 /TAXON_ID=311385 /ORGANISM="Pseudokeronopsis sp., Strain OXSARD2" /LENGTH=113 /DNA_ID=CAMNT_0010844321 /DNA_START=410 /DNA_END=754 /DNA_ORIENTATION=+
MKVKICWNYGGKEVYIIGSFTNWEQMIKLNSSKVNQVKSHSISMYVRAGVYYYYFVVDGKVRFAPDQPSMVHKSEKIVNYVSIDELSIMRAEKARKTDVKNLAECFASEESWI